MPQKEIKNEITILSTDQGADFVSRGLKRLDELSGVPRLPLGGEKPKLPSKIVLINPATEQRASFTEFDENRAGIETLLGQGYMLAESEGRLPPWIFRK